jgi:hypothetical protein
MSILDDPEYRKVVRQRSQEIVSEFYRKHDVLKELGPEIEILGKPETFDYVGEDELKKLLELVKELNRKAQTERRKNVGEATATTTRKDDAPAVPEVKKEKAKGAG